jgi:hypothetical protein
MGLTFSNLFNRLWSTEKDHRILMVGLDAAGKTTILYKLHVRISSYRTLHFHLTRLFQLGEVVSTIPSAFTGFHRVTCPRR